MTQRTVEISWCRDAARARKLARLFSENLTESYISHSELQGPRARSPTEWVGNIAEVLEQDLLSRISNADDAPPNQSTMLAAGISDSSNDIGLLLVTFSRAAAVPYAVLEDIVIRADHRDGGFGRQALDWYDAECRKRGIFRQFLESGASNDRAHKLFERDGYSKVSVVMMKALDQ